jgi:glycosyltransferase involved in cell wall biosynthesis
MVSDRLSILLSTYNSETYLIEQIDSILSQTVKDWILYIRDDGSSDSTIFLIENYCEQHDNIILLKDELNNLGAKNSFIKLLSDVDAHYYMFCDHDDVWLSSKVEKTLNKMKEIESQYPQKPILVFTDLKVVDADLNVISNSLWRYQHTNPMHAKDIYALSISNPVTGCTIMINQKAKEVSLPMSQKSLMHDLWIALNVTHYGYVDFIDEPTILYRQHNENIIGAQKTNIMYYYTRLTHFSKVVKDNIKVIRMINSLSFKINHIKRILLKLNMMKDKLYII